MAAYQMFWSRAEASFVSFDQRRAWSDLGSMAGAEAAAARPPKKLGAEWCQCAVGGGVDCGGPCYGGTCEPYYGCGSIGTSLCNGFCG
jgi:hypothetical protein